MIDLNHQVARHIRIALSMYAQTSTELDDFGYLCGPSVVQKDDTIVTVLTVVITLKMTSGHTMAASFFLDEWWDLDDTNPAASRLNQAVAGAVRQLQAAEKHASPDSAQSFTDLDVLA